MEWTEAHFRNFDQAARENLVRSWGTLGRVLNDIMLEWPPEIILAVLDDSAAHDLLLDIRDAKTPAGLFRALDRKCRRGQSDQVY